MEIATNTSDIQVAYDAQAHIDAELTERQRIITEAKTWLDTPFHDKARVKGVGCDCATFIYEVFAKLRDVPPLPDYPVQWFLNHGDEIYMDMIGKCGGHEVSEPTGPADLFLVKFGRTYAHGGIIINWPNKIIFANPRCKPARVMINAYHENPMFIGRELKFFSLFGA